MILQTFNLIIREHVPRLTCVDCLDDGRFTTTDELFFQTNKEHLFCCPWFGSSGIKTGNRRIMHHNFLIWLFVVFDEPSVQTNNPSVARFYIGKFDRRTKRRT